MYRIIIPLLALVGIGKASKRRRIIDHLSGRTPEEAHEIVKAKASRRMNDERATELADRVVSKLDAKGVLVS